MTRQIIVDISPAGSTTVEAQGFKGKGCAAATEHIEIALGGAAKKTKKPKPEFHMPDATGVKNKLTF